MKKNLGIVQAVYPMPVLIVAAYDENGKVNAMNAAWGMICNADRIALFIDEDHKTTQNILKSRAFTVSLADRAHMDVADFFGIATGNKMEDKFERTGMHAVRSDKVDAPVIEEYPLTLECRVVALENTVYGFRVLGEIVNVLADEKVLDEKGRVDPTRLNAFIFDQCQSGYYKVGEKVGQAWKSGTRFMK